MLVDRRNEDLLGWRNAGQQQPAQQQPAQQQPAQQQRAQQQRARLRRLTAHVVTGLWLLAVAAVAVACGSDTVTSDAATSGPGQDDAAVVSDTESVDVSTPATDDTVADSGPSCPDPDTSLWPADADAELVCDEADPTVCFDHEPTAEETVADLPMPPTGCCADVAPTFAKEGDELPEPTLAVELGVWDSEGAAFVAYEEGAWAPLRAGIMAGGFHIWAGFRVTLPGGAPAKVKLQVSAQGLVDCQGYALGTSPVVFADRVGDSQQWQYANEKNPGVQVGFPYATTASCAFCGRWLDLRVAVRDSASGAWGEARRTLRLYDGISTP